MRKRDRVAFPLGKRHSPPSALRIVGALALAIGMVAGARPSHAGQVQVDTGMGMRFQVPVTSLKEARFKSTIRQQTDYSCGSAALASLLHHHYGYPVDEKTVFAAMYNAGDKEKIQKQGFSLLDMKNYLTTLGINSEGYRITLDKLAVAKIPAITVITTKGFKHFVVIKGIRDDAVLVGDPALGVKAYPREEFEKAWQGVAFILRDHEAIGQASFNRAEEWALRVKPPVRTAAAQWDSLASFTAISTMQSFRRF